MIPATTAGQRRLDHSGAILEAALATADLGRRYRRGSPWALKNLSVDIPRGTITALVGPNGAGKSTLIRCWLGFERPDQGSAYVSGIEVRANPQAALERIGYVSQSNSLYGDLSIADHFRLAATYRRRFDLSNATGHVSRLGLDTNRKIAELSGGEQAQVALALALSMKADVLLLDEPLASLDPLARREFLNTLKASVRESGSTALLSSHIVSDVEDVSDRLLILAGGDLLWYGRIEEARASHATVAEREGLEDVVGRFPGLNGERLALVRKPADTGNTSTLEDVVLGYLAGFRGTRA